MSRHVPSSTRLALFASVACFALAVFAAPPSQADESAVASTPVAGVQSNGKRVDDGPKPARPSRSSILGARGDLGRVVAPPRQGGPPDADTSSTDPCDGDAEPPVVNCPSNITVSNDPGQCGAAVSFTVMSSDNCPGVSHFAQPMSGSFFPVGTTTVTAIAVDMAGNMSQCQFDVTVNDTEAPTLFCPQDITVDADLAMCGAIVDFAPSAQDNCPGNVTIVSTPAASSFFPVGLTQVMVTATDEMGNQSQCTFNVTVNDAEDPTVACPADITMDNDPGTCGATVQFMAQANDNCPGVISSASPASATFFPVGLTQVAVTSTDAAGNQAQCTFNVTVNDAEDPVVTCPADITVGSDPGQCGAVVQFTPQASDNCPGVQVVASPASGSFFPVGLTQVTVTATDAAGNQAQCNFNVTVNDTENPVVACPADIAVGNDPGQCGATVQFTPQASDNCPGVTFTASPASGSFFPVGLTQVTVTATDAAGNQAQCNFNVTVNDTENPVVVCPADITVGNDSGQCGATVQFTPQASDNCPGVTFTASPASGSFFSVGTTQVVVTATDATGNQAQCRFDVTVNDTEDPVITCPANTTIECGGSGGGQATATDNCSATVTSSDVVEGGCPGSISRTWTATDAAGNSSTCEQIIMLADTTPPEITCPPDVTIECGDSDDPAQTGRATADDACDESPDVTYDDVVTPQACTGQWLIQRTWTATDSCGNASTCTQLIQVDDTKAPTIDCPPDVVVGSFADAQPPTSGEPIVADICPGQLDVTWSDDEGPGRCNDDSVILRTWTVTDSCGNSSTCVQRVEVQNCCALRCEPGCGSPDCENLVCAEDPYCCETEWDAACVLLSLELCATCQPLGPCCIEHGTPGCDDPVCEELVCNTEPVDPFCCTVAWDSECAGQALGLCDVCMDDPPPPGEPCDDCQSFRADVCNALASSGVSPLPAFCVAD